VLNPTNNSNQPLGFKVLTAFKIYFDKPTKSYFLASGSENPENESIVFIKLDKKFVFFNF
jgi:hypothetical protein